MAKLAIKGHATRGKEAIEILEMLGGKHKIDSKGLKWFNGTNIDLYYTIKEDNYIHIHVGSRKDGYIKFSLEEFLEKYPYKVGDKVIYQREVFPIIGMKWSCSSNTVIYTMKSNYGTIDCYDSTWMKPYKEKTMEENIKEKCDLINFNSHYIFNFADKVELILKDDWEVKNEDGRTYVVRKQQTYPKTYNECWKILDAGEEEVLLDGATSSEDVLFGSFIKLKRCRDAYWKIAGEWKPDLDSKQHKFAISNVGNKISFEVYGEYNSILCFPTEEMRDSFYENFKDLIEQCKELL